MACGVWYDLNGVGDDQANTMTIASIKVGEFARLSLVTGYHGRSTSLHAI